MAIEDWIFAPGPDRDDEQQAKRWRGSLFHDFDSPLMWKDKHYKLLEPPNSVTFPICAVCHHIIWNWPHFQEDPPKEAMCDVCWDEEERSQS
jgi:hypothetical protein